MTEATPLSTFFQVSEQFHRSVNIAADYRGSQAFDQYIITSLSRDILLRIADGLKENGQGRAWSITGPYGAGKSAFALFMANILGYPPSDGARASLRVRDSRLLDDLFERLPGLTDRGYVVVPIVGGREPISWSLLEGLVRSLSAQAQRIDGLDQHVVILRDLHESARRGDLIPAARIAQVVQDVAETVESSAPSALGILIIYDELGRTLEHAALYPEQADIGLLQTLAELAARSARAPIGLVTILHQAFEHYAANLSVVQRREWAKVQGRFDDIGFLASPGELLGIVDRAIMPVHSEGVIDTIIASQIDCAERLDLLPKDLDAQSARQVLVGCAPLHPTVALVLGPLFRSRLSQNERSLFAFLTSGEPHGFQEYLRGELWGENEYRPFYRLDRLYDYVSAALGSVLYTQPQGKRWAEIEDALDRLPKDSPHLDGRMVKTIGLLGLLGHQRELKASEDVLAYALSNGDDIGDVDVHAALARLQELGIAVYRRFKDAFSLWEGSDIDLDERYDKGLAHIDRAESVASLLHSYGDIKPYVAKRHLHDTGTLRYFAPWIIDSEDLDAVSDRSLGTSDGAVVFVLGTGGAPTDKVVSEVTRFSAQLTPPKRQFMLFALPGGVQGIREALEETMAWEWVARNTPELEGDSVARRELAGRRLAAQDRLRRATARTLEPTLAYRTCRWIRAGKELSFRSGRDLRATISDACDEAYCSAPIVKNELVNRSQPSSAAAAARRNLVERMVTHAAEPKLGMDGYPPEMSMYLSVLEQTGIHHQEGDAWVFGPPAQEDTYRVTPVWRAMDRFLETTQRAPRPATELYEVLKQPPFGIREGVLPIYLVAAMLHWDASLAVYEEGRFIPEVGPAECERLMRVPARFSLQRYGLDNSIGLLLHTYSELFGQRIDPQHVSILTAVRPILAFANQLPHYTHLTESLSERAIAVREALFAATEPQHLLFDALPRALGFQAGDHGTQRVDEYLQSLRGTLAELHHAYEELLTSIQRQLCDVLLIPADLPTPRHEVALRAQLVRERVGDLRLKAFVLRLTDRTLADREWLESVAALLTNKPPSQWNDGDVLRYSVAVADMAGRFRRMEEIAFSHGEPEESTGAVYRMRLSVTDMLGREQREVVRISPEEENQVRQTVAALTDALRAAGADQRMRVMAVAELARKTLESLSQSEESDD